MTDLKATIECARELDERDELRSFRELFHIPKDAKGQDLIYLCGNSLGLQPKGVRGYITEMLDDWEKLGVAGHFRARRPWMPYHETVAESLAQVVGGLPSEVVAMNSLTVNLHLMMVSFYRPTQERFKILTESNAFPSDQYAVQSQVRFHGYSPTEAVIEVGARKDDSSSSSNALTIATEEIIAAIEQNGDKIALVLLGGVNYLSGQLFELDKITKAAHRAGAVVGIDLAHAAGNVPLQLHEWGVDFAVWCSYKYLNSGPGGIAGAFVHERHHSADLQRFSGWWGHDKATRFEMPHDFTPIQTAESWQLSNPPILPLAALRASLDIFDQAKMARLCKKSVDLTQYLEYLIDDADLPGVEVITPRDPDQRGAQLSIRTPFGRSLFDKISSAGVVCDWREPDIIRVAPTPLYNSFEDVFAFSQILKSAHLNA